MAAGLRNTKVIIQSATEGKSSLGGVTESSWATYATEWAKVVDLSGGESDDGNKRVATQQYRLEMLYNTTTAAITKKMRVSMGSVYLNILAAVNLGMMNKEIHLTCEVRDDS